MAVLLIALPLVQPVAAQDTLIVCYIETTTKEVVQGGRVSLIFGVFYPGYYYCLCGEPAELMARNGQTHPTASFILKGSPQLRFIDIPVNSTGRPGEYQVELDWPGDAPIGKLTAFVIEHSLYDGATTGPELDSSHVETPFPVDDSTFSSTRPSVTITDILRVAGMALAFLVPILFLIFLLVFMYFRRRNTRRSALRPTSLSTQCASDDVTSWAQTITTAM